MMSDEEIIRKATGMDKMIYKCWKKSPLAKQIHSIIEITKKDVLKKSKQEEHERFGKKEQKLLEKLEECLGICMTLERFEKVIELKDVIKELDYLQVLMNQMKDELKKLQGDEENDK